MSSDKKDREYFKEIAKRALEKKAPLGNDIDTLNFIVKDKDEPELQDLSSVPKNLEKTLINVGIDINERNRSGTYIQEGNKVGFCRSLDKEKVEILPIGVALKKYDWLWDYYWKAIPVDTDKYTAETEMVDEVQGYFIHAKEGANDIFPIQSCLFLNLEGLKQIVHNIIITEPNSKLNVITGCTVHPHVRRGLHLGTSEFYLKENSQLTFTMIHYWSEKTAVRPRTAIIQEKNTSFINNYVLLSSVNDIQSNPITYLNGDNAQCYFQTLIHGKGNSIIDLGARSILKGSNTKAELISKIIGDDNSYVVSRGEITGIGYNSYGHIACNGLLISNNAKIDSIPRIKAETIHTTLTHEASVGKIGEDQILYLKSRGLNEEEARDLIISGFLEVDTSNLPKELAEETKKLIEIASKAAG